MHELGQNSENFPTVSPTKKKGKKRELSRRKFRQIGEISDANRKGWRERSMGGEGEEHGQQGRKRFRDENRWELQELTRREPCNTSLAMAVNSHPCLDSSEPGIRVPIRELNGSVPGIGDVVSDLNGSGIWFGNSMVREPRIRHLVQELNKWFGTQS
jgi:hypothetical protein